MQIIYNIRISEIYVHIGGQVPTTAVRMVMVSSSSGTPVATRMITTLPNSGVQPPSVTLRPRAPASATTSVGNQIYRTSAGQLISFPSGRLPNPIPGTHVNFCTQGNFVLSL